MPKIGIDCRLVDAKLNTGISRYSQFIVEYYEERYGADNVFLIMSYGSRCFDTKCTIIRTHYKPYNIFHFLAFWLFIRKWSFDILHTPFYSALFVKPKGITSIVTVHDLMYRIVDDFFNGSRLMSKLKVGYFDLIVKMSLSNANVIISVSETTMKDVINCFGFESYHVPEFSDIEALPDFTVLQKLGLTHKEYFMYCGNNRPHKNLNFVREAFAYCKGLPSLVLVGKGHKEGNNVLLAGFVSDSELKALYISARAFIFPSLYEGFGLPVLESLKSGTVVLASNISAFQEFDSPNVHLFDLDDPARLHSLLYESLNFTFVEDNEIWKRYDKWRIYELMDKILVGYI
jgi:glycosyltransferase involved in cell wall biosynthesis